MTKDKGHNGHFGYALIGFAILIAVVYMTGLSIPLLGPDEPRYTQVAREMFERGDWITPKLGGFDWFEKPALLYWLQIASFKLFGVGEFAARFGSALFGLGTVLALYFLGKTVDKEQTRDSKPETRNSMWFPLVGASSLGLIVFSRGASFDIILTFPVAAALVCFYIWDSEFRRSSVSKLAPIFGFFFFVGVALIAKGLVGIVFPFAIVGFYFLLTGRFWPKSFILNSLWGFVVIAAVAAVWYAPMYHVNGWKFIDEFIIQHHFQRYTSNKYLHPQPFYFFFWVLPLMTLPWLPFFFASLFRESRGVLKRETTSPIVAFGFAWMLVPLVFFSVSGSKLPGYILPAVPGALILTAFYVREFAGKAARRAFVLKTLAVVTLVASAITAQFVIAPFLHEETVRHLMQTANGSGFTNDRVLMLHTISHSAEFYAAGRLLRDADGKQKRLFGVSEVISEMKSAGRTEDLVMVPLEYVGQLTKNDQLETRVLDDNGELAIVVVKLRQ